MAEKTKYRVSYKELGSRHWRNAPMQHSLHEAVQAYKFWGRRPTKNVVLAPSIRNEEGDWLVLNESEFLDFQNACTPLMEVSRLNGGIPEVKQLSLYQD